MDKNVRIAKELVKIARELVSGNTIDNLSQEDKDGIDDIKQYVKEHWKETDSPGARIFLRWLKGDGDWLNAPFGKYLMDHNTIRIKIARIIQKEILTDFIPNKKDKETYDIPKFNIKLADNGYVTGYQLLHGTDINAGGFKIDFKLEKKTNKKRNGSTTISIIGRAKCVWNDYIDANDNYDGEQAISDILKEKLHYIPKDYKISIPFEFEFSWSKKNEDDKWEKKGYPWELL